jgi:hypothetical protein
MRGLDIVLDNPILVKHLRSRLRPSQAVPVAAIVLVMAVCTTWAGMINWIDVSSAVTMVLGFQVVILTLGGSNQINASLGGARTSGILDFHRVSPVPPGVVALGFFLGAPIREYVLAAISVPFALILASSLDAFDSWTGLLRIVQVEVALLATTWVVHAVTMISCLARKKARGSLQGAVVGFFLLLGLGYGAIGLAFGAQWLMGESRTMNFFGAMIPWLAWLLIFEAPALGFLGLAAARKMGADRTHAYTKAQALACMATLTVLALAGLWKVARLLPATPFDEPTPTDAIILAAVYVLSLAAMVLAVTITPDAGEYTKGVRRAARAGRRRPGPWSDAGSNRVALFALAALVLVGATAVVQVVGRQPILDAAGVAATGGVDLSDEAWLASRQAMASRPIAIGVLTVAYVGLGLQFFSLRSRRSGVVLMGLFLFLAWLVPMLAGAALGLGGPADQGRALTVLALSPVPGLALSSGLGNPPSADAIQLAALAPPITFAFLFNYLLVVTQRKIDRSLHAKEKEKATAPAAAVEV